MFVAIHIDHVPTPRTEQPPSRPELHPNQAICLRSFRCVLSTCDPLDEEINDSDHEHDGACFDKLPDVLGQTSVATEPGKGALDDPASGQEVEALGIA
jgi:hypothetical protein